MCKTVPSRRLIALFAAYIVALHALVLPLTVAGHRDFAGVDQGLCLSASSDRSTPGPSRHDTSCACAAGCGMTCHAPVLAGPPSFMLKDHLPRVGVIARIAPITATVRPAGRSPLSARAPPLA